MARERAIQIRVSHEEYEAIKSNAGDKPIGEFLRDLGLRAYEGAPVDRILFDEEPPKTDVQVIAGTAVGKTTQGVEADVAKQLTRLIKQLEAQGNPDAEEVARKRLGM